MIWKDIDKIDINYQYNVEMIFYWLIFHFQFHKIFVILFDNTLHKNKFIKLSSISFEYFKKYNTDIVIKYFL